MAIEIVLSIPQFIKVGLPGKTILEHDERPGTDIHGVEDPCRHGLAADLHL